MTNIPRKLKRLVMVPLCSLFFTIGVVTVHAATYYVATTGNNSNSGTVRQPFRTISKGLSIMAAGDTLYIRGGTYTESISNSNQTIPTGTSWADAPLISGYPGETVILQLPSTSTGGNHIYLWPTGTFQYLRFANLVLDGSFQNLKISGTASYIKFENLEIKNGFHQCVQLGIDTHHVWFVGGRVHDCGLFDTSVTPNMAGGYPFYIGGTDHLLEQIEVYNSNSFCVHIYDSNVSPARVTVRNSTFHHCAGTLTSSAAILTKGDSHLIYNNIVYSTGGHGIMTYGATNAKFYNNTVYGVAQVGIYVYPGSTNTDVRNNIAYANKSTQILDQGTDTILSKNLTSDPSFVNAAAFNFNLRSSSPAIDAGDLLSVVKTDIRLSPRPNGATHDIGAFEEGTTSDSTSPGTPKGLKIN